MENEIQSQCELSAQSLLKKLKERWPEEHALQTIDITEFKERLAVRWGKPLNLLRIMLTSARELGNESYVRNHKKEKNKSVNSVVIRLHARACQVAAEIITLLENGYADGAMARWRTLHEISITAAIIDKFGEEIAIRYLDHHAVESKRALDGYEKCHTLLGYKDISDAEKNEIKARYDEVIKKYEENFTTDYGWAAIHLKNKKPNFATLEEHIGRSEMRAYYKMASYNVHSSPKGIFFRLGQLNQYSDILQAGVSNAGLEEPGQNTAHTLTQITALLLDESSTSYDDGIIPLMMMLYLRDEVITEFVLAGQELQSDDNKVRKLIKV